jgi:hypothetical protein
LEGLERPDKVDPQSETIQTDKSMTLAQKLLRDEKDGVDDKEEDE